MTTQDQAPAWHAPNLALLLPSFVVRLPNRYSSSVGAVVRRLFAGVCNTFLAVVSRALSARVDVRTRVDALTLEALTVNAAKREARTAARGVDVRAHVEALGVGI